MTSSPRWGRGARVEQRQNQLLGEGTKQVRTIYKLLLVALVTLSAANLSRAQSSTAQPTQASNAENATGPTAFAQFVFNRSNLGSLYNEGIGIGYNFTQHLGGDVGFTLLTVQSPFSIVTNHDWRWTTLMGDPFLDVRYTTQRYGLNFTSILTGTAPLSSAERVYSTGRFGVDWFNHVETHYKGFSPFVNFGAANGTVDRYVLPRPYDVARPYQTLGFISDFEGGASYTLLRYYSVGASAYALLPAGSQKVFSRLVSPNSPVAGDANHHRVWNNVFESVGNSSLTRDNGYSGWLNIARIKYLKNLDVQIGYTYSIHYAFGTAFVMLRFNGTSLFRTLTATQ